MVFLIEELIDIVEVSIYDNVEQLTNMIEWQDIFEGKAIILDEEGQIYIWDASKTTEYGSVYGYTLKVQGTNYELLEKCGKLYEELGKPDEFEMDKKDLNKYS